MTKRTVVVAAMFTLALGGTAGAQDKPKIINKPPPFVEGDDPLAMFREYCSPCHGSERKRRRSGRPCAEGGACRSHQTQRAKRRQVSGGESASLHRGARRNFGTRQPRHAGMGTGAACPARRGFGGQAAH